MFDAEKAKKAVEENWPAFVEELQAFCRIRSRREEPEGMQASAEFIANSVTRWGGHVEIIPWEKSFPYVLADFSGISKHLLHFNHYDTEIEPTGDDAEWITPPFSSTIRDGKVYARGIADDKGAIMSRIHAAAAWKLSGQEAPVRSTMIFEGKAEVHSPGLRSFVEAHSDRFDGDGILYENSWIDAHDRLLLKLSEKGILYFKISVRTLARDLTSQNTVLLPSATLRLSKILASLQDVDGKVLVPGFYDDVILTSPRENELIEEIPFPGSYIKDRAGVEQFINNLDDVSAARAIRLVPSITIGGMMGGDVRDEVTLGIPSSAWAKLEVRLVPDQDPGVVLEKIRTHLEASGFADAEIELMAANKPNHTDINDPFVQLVSEATAEVYGRPAILDPYTQWIGNQGVFSGMPIVGVGVSRLDSNIDGPNEHIRLDDYKNGIFLVIEVMARMANNV